MILCNFQENLCDWAVKSDNNYKWIRRTSDQLANNNIPGPESDLNEEKDKFFLMASDKLGGDSPIGSTTQILSPDFKTSEHELECFTFWYQFDVRYLENIMIV